MRMLDVWLYCFAAEKNTSLRFTVRNKGATGAHTGTADAQKKNQSAAIIFPFPEGKHNLSRWRNSGLRDADAPGSTDASDTDGAR